MNKSFNNSELWVIKHTLIALTILATLYQLIVFGTNHANSFCTLLILFSTIISSIVALNPTRFYLYPLWCFGLLSLNITTNSGAIILKTIELSPVIDKLLVPEKTFSMLSIAVITFSFALALKPLYPKDLTINFIQSKFIQWKIIYWPSNHILWWLGIVGLACTFIARVGFEGEENRSFLDKFLTGFTFLRYLPILTLFREFNGEVSSKKAIKPVLLFFIFLVLIGIIKNSRGIFMDGFILAVLMTFMSTGISQFRFSSIKLKTYFLTFILISVALMSLNRLAVAMESIRDIRTEVSFTELVNLTINAFVDDSKLNNYEEENSGVVNALGYGEKYVKSSLASRFILTKYHDNMLYYLTDYTGEMKTTLIGMEATRLLTIFPTPFLKIVGINIDKSALFYSFGDAALFVKEGWGLGGFRIGSLFSFIYALIPLFFPLIVVGLIYLIFSVRSLFVIHKEGQIIISPIILIGLWDIVVRGVNTENLSHIISAIVRGLPQTIILYLILVKVVTVCIKESKDN